MKKTLQIANGIAVISTIIVNYLSNTGVFNGKTVAEISNKYQNYFTPAGYAFSIWGLIYLGLLTFVIYTGQGLFKKIEDKWPVLEIGWWFVISCIANSFWVIAWLYEYTGLTVLIMIIILISLVKIILNTRMELDNLSLKKIAFVWWPFSIYSGWICVALIADIAAYLTKINWNGFGISQIGWTIIMICIAGIVNLFITWKRNMREFALVGVWALVAIAVANWNVVESIVIIAIAVAVILFISVMIHIYKNHKVYPLKK
ncbi:MAG: tryptophan-rich sensory protein [Bacteroidota bacterium]|nr:tryptophan-rich sensory protein [Bacteroidota bacterium]